MAEPRTLLEAIVRQRQLSWEEAAKAVADAAREHNERGLSLSSRHLGRLARRERGNGRPNPATCRALQYTFGHTIDELLGPYAGSLAVTTSGLAVAVEGQNPTEVLIVAADRARRFLAFLQTTSDEAVHLLYDDTRDLVQAYPTRPLPEILGHLVSAQEAVFTLLERPQRPDHARQLYFLGGTLGGLLAKASHDLADPHAALTQSRTAWLCAEQADHHGLRAWIAGMQSLISYWARRPHDSIRVAQRGAEHAERAGSTALVWLADSEARAWALLGNADAAQNAIDRAERAWDDVRPDELDELGESPRSPVPGICTSQPTPTPGYPAIPTAGTSTPHRLSMSTPSRGTRTGRSEMRLAAAPISPSPTLPSVRSRAPLTPSPRSSSCHPSSGSTASCTRSTACTAP